MYSKLAARVARVAKSASWTNSFFKDAKKTLHRGLVPAVRSTAHAAQNAVLGQEELVVLAGVLAAAIRVRQQSLVGQVPLHGHCQGVHDQAALRLLRHRPGALTLVVRKSIVARCALG